jgi:general stress protein CsbA
MDVETEKNAPPSTPETYPLVVAEYDALRGEILKRIELRSQVTSLTLVVFGTIVGVAIGNKTSAIALLYPILATLLAANWTYNGYATKELGDYIQTSIEAKVGEDKIGWQHKIKGLHRSSRGLNIVSSGGIFLGTSILAVLVALSFAKFDLTVIFLLIADAISMVYSLILLIQFYRQHVRSRI